MFNPLSSSLAVSLLLLAVAAMLSLVSIGMCESWRWWPVEMVQQQLDHVGNGVVEISLLHVLLLLSVSSTLLSLLLTVVVLLMLLLW